jgi:hypothetical protein
MESSSWYAGSSSAGRMDVDRTMNTIQVALGETGQESTAINLRLRVFGKRTDITCVLMILEKEKRC